MIYLFLGDGSLAKDQKIKEIKAELLPSLEARKFDFEIFHASNLHSDELKQALLALPVVGKRRIVVIRTIQKLTPQHKKLLLPCIQTKDDRLVLILDSDEVESKSSFMKEIAPYAKIFHFGRTVRQNVFDMTRAMTARKPAEALKILNQLFQVGDHPLQILGGLVWFWGKNKDRVAAEYFRKGLFELKEADLNIKRSRLKPEQTLEILVVKLCSLTVL